MDPDWHRKTITRLRLEMLQAQDIIDGIAPPSPPRERELDEEIEDQITQFEGNTHRQQAARSPERLPWNSSLRHSTDDVL